jgi:hypothetical protein
MEVATTPKSAVFASGIGQAMFKLREITETSLTHVLMLHERRELTGAQASCCGSGRTDLQL